MGWQRADDPAAAARAATPEHRDPDADGWKADARAEQREREKALEDKAIAAEQAEADRARAIAAALDEFVLAGGHMGPGAGIVLVHLGAWRAARAERALAENALERAGLPQITDGGASS